MADERLQILADFLRSSWLVDPSCQLTPDTHLLTETLIDSMGMVMLIAFVEERFGVRVQDADLRGGKVDTIADILALVDRRRLP